VSQSVCVCEIVKLSGFERPQKNSEKLPGMYVSRLFEKPAYKREKSRQISDVKQSDSLKYIIFDFEMIK
jgi:hypothetical protein